VVIEEEVVNIIGEKETNETKTVGVDLAQQVPTTPFSDFGDSDHDTANLLGSDNESVSTVTHDDEDQSSFIGLSLGDKSKNEQETGEMEVDSSSSIDPKEKSHISDDDSPSDDDDVDKGSEIDITTS
jgi:hypothetical protein